MAAASSQHRAAMLARPILYCLKQGAADALPTVLRTNVEPPSKCCLIGPLWQSTNNAAD